MQGFACTGENQYMTTEQFQIISTTTNIQQANIACQALEDADIPHLLEHLMSRDARLDDEEYHILVPSTKSQLAAHIVQTVEYAQRAAAAL